MKLVFNLDDVICTPAKGIKFGVVNYIDNCLPIEDTIEFMYNICNMTKIDMLIWRNRLAEKGFELTPNEIEQYILIAAIVMSLIEPDI